MKKYNDIEDFILKNRDEFDDSYPNLKIWSNIEKELDKTSAFKTAIPLNFWIIAVLSIALAISIFWILKNSGSQVLNEDEVQFFAEIEHMERYYDLESSKLLHSVGRDFTMIPDSDLSEIEKNISEIKAELKNIPEDRKELALKALLESYRTKLFILERIMEQYELMDLSKENNNEKRHNI
jgi:hypothetical protein